MLTEKHMDMLTKEYAHEKYFLQKNERRAYESVDEKSLS